MDIFFRRSQGKLGAHIPILAYLLVVHSNAVSCCRYLLEDAKRLQKAFLNTPKLDFLDENLKFELTKQDNGYTWTRVFSGCLEYIDTIAVPINMPPAVVTFLHAILRSSFLFIAET